MPLLATPLTRMSVRQIQSDVNGITSIVVKLDTFYGIHGQFGTPLKSTSIWPTSEQILHTPLRSILHDLRTMFLRRGSVEVTAQAMVIENEFILLVLVIIEGLSSQSRGALLEPNTTISKVLEGLNKQCWARIDKHILDEQIGLLQI